jgi:putative ABC transport system permease protein
MATLALGLGPTTALYSVLSGFTRGLPVPEPAEIVALRASNPRLGLREVSVSARDYAAWRVRQRSFEDIAAYRAETFTITSDESYAAVASGARIEPAAFEMLGVEPLLGRYLDRGDVDAGEPAVVIGSELWRLRFDADAEVLGRALRIGGRPHTIVGVMPASFRFPLNHQLWVALGEDAEEVEVFGRLADGVSMRRAQAEMDTIVAAVADAYPEDDAGMRVRVTEYTRGRGEGGELAALAAMGLIVGAMLLVACANVANLLMVRGVDRARELAVHAALGARRSQVAAQMLTETLLLALGGGVAGFGFAAAIVGFINYSISDLWGYYWMAVRLDTPVFAFNALLILVVCAVSGLLPALSAARVDPQKTLKSDAGLMAAPASRRLGRVLVAAEIAVSTVALIIAGTLAHGLLDMRNVGSGYPTEDVVTAWISFPDEGYAADAQRLALLERLRQELSGRPGVRRVTTADSLPGYGFARRYADIEGRVAADDADRPRLAVGAVDETFFETFEMELVAGRTLTGADGASTQRVAVIDASLADRVFDGDALGRRIRVADEEHWMTVVGVVSDLDDEELFGVREDLLLRPLAQAVPRRVAVALRVDGDPLDSVAVARQAMAQVDPDLPLESVATLAATLEYFGKFWRTAGSLAVLGSLGGLLVAAVGLYGLIAFNVRQRTAEFGLRMAVGAEPRRVIGLVLRYGLVQMIGGVAVGMSIGALLTPLFGGVLLTANPHEPSVFLAVPLVFTLVGLLATLAPARRAVGVDPMAALRG